MIYMFLSNNPSSGDINLSNLSCLSLLFQNFKEHLVIECIAEEACIAETSCPNPCVPVTKLFTSVTLELQRTPCD